jgi:RHS repeat-associated protein
VGFGEWGDASGLLYLRARYYLPQAGIFTSRDPFPGFTTLPVTLQPYLYAAGNPLRYTDPSGKFIFLALLAVAAAGGLAGGALYGYGSQVIRNLNQNHFCLWGALTTQIDVNTIGFYAVTGLFLGTGIGVIGMSVQALMGYFSAQTFIGAASTAACGDGDCLNEVVAVEESVQKGITVLGRYRNYLDVADDVGGNALNVPEEVWDSLNTLEKQWAFNQKFLDDAIARGDYFYLANRWADAKVGTFFRMELDYLFSKGYTLSLYQNYLIPPSIP